PCGSTPISGSVSQRNRDVGQHLRSALLTTIRQDSPDVLEAGSRKKPIPAANRLQPKTFNPSSSAQAMVAMKYSCFEHGASNCALAKLCVRKMSAPAHSSPTRSRNRRGSDNFPATAMGAYERGARPRQKADGQEERTCLPPARA